MKDGLIKILLLTDFSSGYSRDVLRGVVRYAQKKKGWAFYRLPLHFKMIYGSQEIVRWAKKWKVDAIIAQINDIDLKVLQSLGIPIIVQNYTDRLAGVCNLTGDYVGTGRMAADYLIGLGYKDFAYYGINDTVWSRERYEGYAERLDEKGLPPPHAYFEKGKGNESGIAPNFDSIGKWLRNLPENTAVFACDDYHALYLAETCQIHDIPVPDRIAILGVDNDELLCNISTPKLSSIVIDAENGGYRTAQVLDKLITENIKKTVNITVPPIQVITRESTQKYVIQEKYVKIAVDYIKEHYADDISVNTILDLVPISRRVFEKRFKENTGESIYRFIVKYRIEKFSMLLLSSDDPIEDLAVSCGFSDFKNISRCFMKYKGVTPSEFRKRKGE